MAGVPAALVPGQVPRLGWGYNAGPRRVGRAPQVAYDGPG
ncbi:DUF1329 domain-containing protein, partial [Pseudomonas aeruginosa]|nr:DUF1329 domain-containing protein [Pseudomonas aeruginosa]